MKTLLKAEIKKQHIVDVTWGIYGFDLKQDAVNFERDALKKDFHSKEDETPIQTRESFVLWINDEFYEEILNAPSLEKAEQDAWLYIDQFCTMQKVKANA